MQENPKIILITGTNRGIGFGLVEKFCQSPNISHYLVLATARNEDLGLESLSKLKLKYPTSANYLLFHQLDVTSEASISKLREYIQQNFKSIDVLINNAAFSNCETGDEPNLHEITIKTFDINLYGPMKVAMGLLSCIKTGGHIINISSRYGIIKKISPEKKAALLDLTTLDFVKFQEYIDDFFNSTKNKTWAQDGWINEKSLDNAYAISKMFLNVFTRLFDRKLKNEGLNIKVNCCHPGWCKTDMGGPNGEKTYLEGAEMGFWLSTTFLDERTDENSGNFYMDFTKTSFSLEM